MTSVRLSHLEFLDSRHFGYGVPPLRWLVPRRGGLSEPLMDSNGLRPRNNPFLSFPGPPSPVHMRAAPTSLLDTHGAHIMHTPEGLPAQQVYDRLSTKTRSFERPSKHISCSVPEREGDQAFRDGAIADAVRHYTMALNDRPSKEIFEKRCAAFAHLGKYSAAITDAERVQTMDSTTKAKLRLQDLHSYAKALNTCKSGYATAHVTLLCNITPPELKMWRSPTPSVYRGRY